MTRRGPWYRLHSAEAKQSWLTHILRSVEYSNIMSYSVYEELYMAARRAPSRFVSPAVALMPFIVERNRPMHSAVRDSLSVDSCVLSGVERC